MIQTGCTSLQRRGVSYSRGCLASLSPGLVHARFGGAVQGAKNELSLSQKLIFFAFQNGGEGCDEHNMDTRVIPG